MAKKDNTNNTEWDEWGDFDEVRPSKKERKNNRRGNTKAAWYDDVDIDDVEPKFND